jgi:hypothetical protein
MHPGLSSSSAGWLIESSIKDLTMSQIWKANASKLVFTLVLWIVNTFGLHLVPNPVHSVIEAVPQINSLSAYQSPVRGYTFENNNPLSLVVQQSNVTWSEPVNISLTHDTSIGPSLCVDPSGIVHVVWCDAVQGAGCDTVYYTEYDGEYWKTPIDIYILPNQNDIIRDQRIACSGDGSLYLYWVGAASNQLYFSKVYAPLAYTVKEWSRPFPIEDFTSFVSSPYLIADDPNNLQMVYAVQIGNKSGIYYIQSEDGGSYWSESVPIHENFQSSTMVDHPRMAIDGTGVLHVVWTEYNYPSVFPPQRIGYAQSSDNGFSWTNPTYISGPYEFAGVIADGKQIHMVWGGTDVDRHKFHRFSNDEGLTWSPVEVTQDRGGIQGYPGLAVDSAGRLYSAMAAGDWFDGFLTFQSWANGIWSNPIKLLDQPQNYPSDPALALGTKNTTDNPDLAIGLGNQIHIIAEHAVEYAPGRWTFNIFYVGGRVDTPSLSPQELPTSTPIPTPTAGNQLDSQASILTSTEATLAQNMDFSQEGQVAISSPLTPILAGIIPALILLTIALFLKVRGHK